MDNGEINALVDAFIGYREMLSPLQSDLHEFLSTYSATMEDIKKLDGIFSGGAREKLNDIYKLLASQAEKSEALANKVDEFLKSATTYTEKLESLTQTFEAMEGRLHAISGIEEKAEQQIARLDTAIEDKRRNYNLKDLEKSLDNYNSNLEQISEFINKEVASKIEESTQSVEQIKQGNDSISKFLEQQGKSVGELVSTYTASNELLKKIVEKQDINEQYIFDMIDRWAEDRRVKTKKR